MCKIDKIHYRDMFGRLIWEEDMIFSRLYEIDEDFNKGRRTYTVKRVAVADNIQHVNIEQTANSSDEKGDEVNIEWTAEERLKIIQVLAAKSLDGPVGETHKQLMEHIMFLCDMPAEFLEQNKRNYEDAIKLASAGFTVEL